MSRVPIKELTSLLAVAIRNYQDDRVPRLGAALAYYMALSLAPTLVIMLAAAAWVFGAKATEAHFIRQIQSLVEEQGATVIRALTRKWHCRWVCCSVDSHR